MQVQHLEKEKKETTHKLKSIAKRIDHLERAYRKEERPLLDKDYEQQQKADRDTFNAIQISLKEQARLTHRDDLATKARLLRMVGDYEARKSIIIARKGEDFAKRKDAAQRKISEEKAKRKKSVLKAQEEERRRIEEEERLIREQEEEERREEEGDTNFMTAVNMILTIICQHVVLKKRPVLLKLKLPLPLKRQPNVKLRSRRPPPEKPVKRSVPLEWSRRGYRHNERKRPSNGDYKELPSATNLLPLCRHPGPTVLQLSLPQPGDDLLPRLLPTLFQGRLHVQMHSVVPLQDRRAPLLRLENIVLVHWLPVVVGNQLGESVRRLNKQVFPPRLEQIPLCAPHHRRRLLLPDRKQKLTTMVSRPSHRRRKGSGSQSVLQERVDLTSILPRFGVTTRPSSY